MTGLDDYESMKDSSLAKKSKFSSHKITHWQYISKWIAILSAGIILMINSSQSYSRIH